MKVYAVKALANHTCSSHPLCTARLSRPSHVVPEIDGTNRIFNESEPTDLAYGILPCPIAASASSGHYLSWHRPTYDPAPNLQLNPRNRLITNKRYFGI